MYKFAPLAMCFALCVDLVSAQPSVVPVQFVEQRVVVHIERQPLDKALNEFAYQTGLQIARLSNSTMETTFVGPLNGDYTLDRALALLLEPVGYGYMLIDARTVAVVPAASSVQPQQDLRKTPAASRDDASPAVSLEEIIVSARRRVERARDVPMVVSTVSGVALLEQDIKNTFDLDKAVAGMTLCCSRGGVRYTFMRGVKGVVGYWAEVPVSLSGSAFYFDMDRVQTLKGPQGTLFGTSTNGGAILFEPVRPSDNNRGYASIALGSEDRRTVEGAVNVTASSSLRLRLGALSHYSDGYIQDLSNGKRYGGEDHVIARISASWQPSESFVNNSVLNYYRSTTSPSAGVNGGGDAVIVGLNPNGRARAVFGEALEEQVARQRELGRYKIIGTSLPSGPRAEVEQFNFVNTSELRLTDALTWRTIGGVAAYRANAVTDPDMTPFPITGSSEPVRRVHGPTLTYTLEPQLQRVAQNGRFSFVIGSFNSWVRPPTPVPNFTVSMGVRTGATNRSEEKTNSIYAEGTYALTERIDLTAGYRHTWDDRRVTTQNFNGDGAALGPQRTSSSKWDAGSYRVGVTWKPTDYAMLYFMHSRGYSSGGFNAGSWPAHLQRYEPESLDNYEIGLKADWLFGDTQLRTHVALFTGDYDDVQVYVPSQATNPDTGMTISGLPLMNAAKGVASGGEFEFTFLPVPSLGISGGVTFTSTRYTQYYGPDPRDPTGQTIADMRSLPFLYAPRWNYAVKLQWQLPVDPQAGRLALGIDYGWQDKVANEARLHSTNPYAWNPPIHNLSAHLSWSDPLGWDGVTVTLLATNLTNFDRMNAQYTGYETTGFFGWGVAPPRAWGLRIRYDFR